MSVAFVVYLTLCHTLRDMRSETIMNLLNGRLRMGGAGAPVFQGGGPVDAERRQRVAVGKLPQR